MQADLVTSHSKHAPSTEDAEPPFIMPAPCARGETSLGTVPRRRRQEDRKDEDETEEVQDASRPGHESLQARDRYRCCRAMVVRVCALRQEGNPLGTRLRRRLHIRVVILSQ